MAAFVKAMTETLCALKVLASLAKHELQGEHLALMKSTATRGQVWFRPFYEPLPHPWGTTGSVTCGEPLQ